VRLHAGNSCAMSFVFRAANGLGFAHELRRQISRTVAADTPNRSATIRAI
jgi:hypothetical protein